MSILFTQPVFTCLKSVLERLGQCVKSFLNLTIKRHQIDVIIFNFTSLLLTLNRIHTSDFTKHCIITLVRQNVKKACALNFSDSRRKFLLTQNLYRGMKVILKSYYTRDEICFKEKQPKYNFQKYPRHNRTSNCNLYHKTTFPYTFLLHYFKINPSFVDSTIVI